jgi:hypothetical protein
MRRKNERKEVNLSTPIGEFQVNAAVALSLAVLVFVEVKPIVQIKASKE